MKKIFLILGLLLIALALLGTIFGASKSGQRLIPSGGGDKLSLCRQDTDCILAIRLDQCCRCPEVVAQQALADNKSLTQFKYGQDYSPEKTIDCRGVVCSPCEPLHGSPICLEGQCRSGEKVPIAR